MDHLICFLLGTLQFGTQQMNMVDNEHGRGQYRVLWQNCQHFASYCVLGEEYMSDKNDLIEKAVMIGAAAVALGAGIAWLFGSSDSDKKESKRKEIGTVRR
uniref:LRAT domain-containing protein n=1 Tax=Panagrolaimus sp. JU765 TaxID=591449 RepID=A0AC34QED0_9BILA